MRRLLAFLILTLFLGGCIKNDIPYPIEEGKILTFSTEGMLSQTRINSQDRTISVTVSDTVNLSALRITQLEYSKNAVLKMDEDRYLNQAKFPNRNFTSLEELPLSADTRVDLSTPLKMTLSTYQDYVWTITATQYVERSVIVDGQMGSAVIDPVNQNVVIYVDKNTPLNKVKVHQFSLGGEHGEIIPDPSDVKKYPKGFDFSKKTTFYVKQAWEEAYQEWQVMVYQTDVNPYGSLTVRPFARTISATLNIDGASPSTKVEYQVEGSSSWTIADDVRATSKGVTVEIGGLSPSTTYLYRVNEKEATGSFTTTKALALEGGSLDYWHQDGKLWNPFAKNGEKFWDTGNKGAVTVSESNSIPSEDTWNGKGKAACLQSKFLVIKFAAGNLFTGTYVKTDGTNGILDFGRPFDAFPTKLRFHYKYNCATINKIGDDDLAYLKGKPDIGTVYIILADWDEPFRINTRKSERRLLDPDNDEHVIAYSKMEVSETISEYQEFTLPINYKVTDRRPKYIVVVASASKYGDYFVGGDGSCLWVDDLELLYE